MNSAPRGVKRLFHGGLMGVVGKGRGKGWRSEAKGVMERKGLTMRVEG